MAEAIWCSIEEIDKDNDYGYPQEAICATCPLCKHEVEIFGRENKSIKRALAAMREECPRKMGHLHHYMQKPNTYRAPDGYI